MTLNTPADNAWTAASLAAARPRALAALLRYFGDLDLAEEAFQEACLRALHRWPRDGAPSDPTAWLILVGRNAALDQLRRARRHVPLPPEEELSDLEDAQTPQAERFDAAAYPDDVLRLLFVCCHPHLPLVPQIALALRVVCGLSVQQIAQAFLVGPAAMEQRITRAKRRIAAAGLPFETPGAAERSERLAAVLAMVYLLFNEGYSASGGGEHLRLVLCEEAIRLARLLQGLFPEEPEAAGLAALLMLQHSRAAARLDAQGEAVLLELQDRRRWDRALIGEGLALLEQALGRGRPGPYQVQAAIAATHARAERASYTDWTEIERLYAALEALQPSAVVRLNRAVAVRQLRGAAAGLALVEPLGTQLADYFPFHGLRGVLLRELGREADARDAFGRALSLAQTAAQAAHVRAQLDALGAPPVRRGAARPIA